MRLKKNNTTLIILFVLIIFILFGLFYYNKVNEHFVDGQEKCPKETTFEYINFNEFDGYERFYGQCLKPNNTIQYPKCPPGFKVDYLNNSCYLKDYNDFKPTCPKGSKYDTQWGTCFSEPTCPLGYKYDTKWGKCLKGKDKKDKKNCSSNFIYSDRLEKCMPDPTKCPSGFLPTFIDTGEKICEVKDVVNYCKENERFSVEEKTCISEKNNEDETVSSCPNRTFNQDGTCVATDKNNKIIKPVCPKNYILSEGAEYCIIPPNGCKDPKKYFFSKKNNTCNPIGNCGPDSYYTEERGEGRVCIGGFADNKKAPCGPNADESDCCVGSGRWRNGREIKQDYGRCGYTVPGQKDPWSSVDLSIK